MIYNDYMCKLDLQQKMKRKMFRYDYILKTYVYEFPVFKCVTNPVITCKVGFHQDSNEIWFAVYDIHGHLYAPYYNREYHRNNMIVKIVDNNINKEFNRLGIKREVYQTYQII